MWVIKTLFDICLWDFDILKFNLLLNLNFLRFILSWLKSILYVSRWLIIYKNLSICPKLPGYFLAFSLSWGIFISQRYLSKHLLSTAFRNILQIIQTYHLSSCLIIRISFELEIFFRPLSVNYKSFKALQKLAINIRTNFSTFGVSRAHIVFNCLIK